MHSVIIPKMGQSTVDVDLACWSVAEGDVVEAGAVLAEIESEKTTIEICAEISGKVAEILVKEGDTVEVGTVICRIEPA